MYPNMLHDVQREGAIHNFINCNWAKILGFSESHATMPQLATDGCHSILNCNPHYSYYFQFSCFLFTHSFQ